MDDSNRVGSQSFLDYIVDIFTTMYDSTAWWILLALAIAVVGFWLLSYVAKKLMVGAGLVVVLASLMTFIAAPFLISYFSALPPIDFFVGLMIGVAIFGVVKKDCMLYLFAIIGLSSIFIGQGGF